MAQLELALHGSMTEDHRFMLGELLKGLAQEDARIAAVEARIEDKLTPYRAQHDLLVTIPGVERIGAATMIAEHGVDMNAFGSPARLAAWAGVAPGNNQSGARTRRAPARKGNVHLKCALHTAAVSAAHTKSTYLRDKYHRIRARSGPGRAAGAVAHKIVIAAYHILATGKPYRDLGPNYLDTRTRRRTQHHLVNRLEQMGYHVTLTPKAA